MTIRSRSEEKLRNGLQRLDASLAPLLPFLEALFALPGADEALRHLDRQHRRQQTLEAIRAVIAAASRHRPQVLVCENLHWIDQSSEDLLAFLAGSLSGLPVLILTTHRTGYTVRWADKPHYTQISLDGLARPEIEDMLTALLGGHEFPAEFLQFIRDKADGNPLFIEELTQALLERSLLIRENGHLRLISEAALEWPATIQDIIRARVDRLEDPVKDTLRMAAVIGREFEFRLLARVSSRPAEIAGHLEALKRLDVIHESRFFPQLEYRFKHAVIQDVIYKSLLVPRRQTLHGLVGQSIEELAADQLEEQAVVLAHHYSRSDHQDHAIKYALLAGDRAARVYANAEAASYYDQALGLTRALTASPERQRAEIDACIKHAQVGTTREALEQDRDNLEQARTWRRRWKTNRAWPACSTGWGGWPMCAAPSRWPPASPSRVWPSPTAWGTRIWRRRPSTSWGEATTSWASTPAPASCWPAASSRCESSETSPRKPPPPDTRVSPWPLSATSSEPCPTPTAASTSPKALANPFVQAAAYNYRAVAYGHQGAGPEAIADCEAGRRVAEGAGDRFRIYLLQFYEGQAYITVGDPGRARELLENSIALAKQLGTTTLLAWGQGLLATALLALGEAASVPMLCEEAIRLAEDTRDRLANALAHRTLAEALARLTPPDVDRAERALLDAIRIQQELGCRPELARSYEAYARLLKRWHRLDEAQRFIGEAVGMFRAMGMARDLVRAEQEASGLT